MINRRGLLRGIFAAGLAPAIVKAEILMPARQIIVPDPFGTRGMTQPCGPVVGVWGALSRHQRDTIREVMLRHAHPSPMMENFARDFPARIADLPGRTIKFRRYTYPRFA